MISRTYYTLDQVCKKCSGFLQEWKCEQDLFDVVMERSPSIDQWGRKVYAYDGHVCIPCFVSIALKLNREIDPWLPPNRQCLVVNWPLYSISSTGPFVVNFNNRTIRKGEYSDERSENDIKYKTVS
jgi:hypothetical protein